MAEGDALTIAQDRKGKGSLPLLIALTAVSVAITLASAVSTALMIQRGWETDRWHGTFHQLMHVGRELSASTWFASALWLLLAFFAFTAGVLAHKKRGYWYALGIIAAIASADETATLHEKFYAAGAALTDYLPFDFFSYRWVIVGVIIAVVIALALFPFVLSLPRHVTIGIIAGGAVFLLGAIVVETIGGHIVAMHGEWSWQLQVSMHIEEFLEYMGVSLAIYALSGMVKLIHDGSSRKLVFTGYRNELAEEAGNAHENAPSPLREEARGADIAPHTMSA